MKEIKIDDLLFISIPIAFFLYFARQYILSIYYSTICKKWPKVKGKISISPYVSDTYGNDRFSTRHRIGKTVNLLYNYTVNGVEYEGDNISFKLDIITNSNLLYRLANMYQVNDEVDVYYHPRKPQVSVLKP
jgi:hypothetical protein